MPDDHMRRPREPSGEDPAPQHERELAQVTAALEHDVGISRSDLTSLILLESLKGFGPQKFKDLHRAGLRPIDVLREPQLLPIPGKRGERFRQALRELDAGDRNVAQARAVRQLLRAHDNNARIVTYDDPRYPRSVYDSNNPIPILYARGNLDVLAYNRTVACVGSRETSPPYSDLHYEFAAHACRDRYTIVSGFALGADTIGHRAAADTGGATVLIMPCGLDRPFPPENKDLYTALKDYDRAVIVSEFPFGTAASTLTLRKRNKLIVAFAPRCDAQPDIRQRRRHERLPLRGRTAKASRHIRARRGAAHVRQQSHTARRSAQQRTPRPGAAWRQRCSAGNRLRRRRRRPPGVGRLAASAVICDLDGTV